METLQKVYRNRRILQRRQDPEQSQGRGILHGMDYGPEARGVSQISQEQGGKEK